MTTYKVYCATPFGPHLVAEFDSERDALRDAADRNEHSTARYYVKETS